MMSERNDGGPAFAHGSPEQGGDPGMTKRDWFAGMAMQGFLSARESSHAGEDGELVLAQDAYIVADAMLAQMEKQP